MLDRLNRMYGAETRMGSYRGRRFSRAEHVPIAVGLGASRRADFIAVSFWRTTGFEHIENWGEREDLRRASGTLPDYAIIGHEVKVSRSDWLHELRHPEKAEEWKQYCHEWYLVASDPAIVRDDLPEDWGLMVPNRGRGLKVLKHAPRLKPLPLPHRAMVGLLRATVMTEQREALDFAARNE